MNINIYHNPNCGTSRNVLALIRHAGVEPNVIEYLIYPPDEQTLRQLLMDMNMSPRELLRTNVPPYLKNGLNDKNIPDDDVVAAMLREPLLINRPIVVSPKGTKLCRPSETVLPLLPSFPRPFIKEDGTIIYPVEKTEENNGYL